MGISGDATEFGGWKPEKAYILKWTEGDVWTARVDIPATVKEVKYKLLTTYKGMGLTGKIYDGRATGPGQPGRRHLQGRSGKYGQALDVQISPRPTPGAPTTPAASARRPGRLALDNITSQPASVSSSSGGGAAPGAHFEPAPGAREEPTPGTPGKRTTPGGISLDPPDFSKGSWRSSSSGGSSAAKGSSGLGAFSQSFSERVERAREAARGEKTAAKASKTDDLPPLADRYAKWDADLSSVTTTPPTSRSSAQSG